jgi:hypothetical protein
MTHTRAEELRRDSARIERMIRDGRDYVATVRADRAREEATAATARRDIAVAQRQIRRSAG